MSKQTSRMTESFPMLVETMALRGSRSRKYLKRLPQTMTMNTVRTKHTKSINASKPRASSLQHRARPQQPPTIQHNQMRAKDRVKSLSKPFITLSISTSRCRVGIKSRIAP